jgi:hypothetical protein
MQPMTKTGVSPTMKRATVVVGLVVIAGAIWYGQRPHSTRASATPSAAAPPAVASPAVAPSKGAAVAVTAARVEKVMKLANAEERRQLAERISAAQAGRAMTHAPAPPRLPDAEPAINKVSFRAAMRELIPMLKECYETALPTLPSPDLEFTAKLRLTGDPDVGTIIDADALVDKTTGEPLPEAFDDCLRGTFMQMALPPIAEGDKLEVHYPFKFAQE